MKQLTYEQIEKIINQHDPIGLLRMGAPTNEYEPEIKDLMNRRNECFSGLDWVEIKMVFESWFYENCISKEQAKAMERDLQNLLLS
jgi:hypothetical protein